MIYVCGDTHLDVDTQKLTREFWPEGQGLTKDDYLIILGDVGFGWFLKSCEREQDLIRWYNQQPWTTLFIDGNHENFDRLFSNEFGEIQMFGERVKRISDSIFYLQRGRVYTIEDKKVFAFGGGESVDKNSRLPNISWWSQELPSHQEMDLGIENLQKHNNRVDYVLTHSCSNELFKRMMVIMDFGYKEDCERSLRSFFSWVERNVDFKEWHFGHFHDDVKFGDSHFLHYKNAPYQLV